jgi:hypothetical protein
VLLGAAARPSKSVSRSARSATPAI